MSKLSNAIGALRAGLVEAVNASGFRRASSVVLDQVRTKVRLLEARETREAEEKKEEDQCSFTECRVRKGSGGLAGGRRGCDGRRYIPHFLG